MIELRKIVPGQPAQFLDVKCGEELLAKLIENKLDLDIYHKSVTPELINALHANGLKLNAWTVDDPADGEKYAEWGIDYITSNILE